MRATAHAGLLLLALAACGTTFAVTDAGVSLGEPLARASFSASGGQLRSADGRFVVTVPGGALSQPVELTIERIGSTAPGAVGPAYRLGPASLVQSSAFDVQFAAEPTDLAHIELAGLTLARQAADGRWERFDDVVVSQAQLSVRRRAFPSSGDWALVRTALLDPARATVRAGALHRLAVLECGLRPDGERSFATDCGAAGLDGLVTRWSAEAGLGELTVNGPSALLRTGSARSAGRVSASLFSRSLTRDVALTADVQVESPRTRITGSFSLSRTTAGLRTQLSGALALDKLGPDADPQPFQGRATIDAVSSGAHLGCVLADAGAVDLGSSYVYLSADGGVRLLLDLSVSASLRCPDAGVVTFRAFEDTCGELGMSSCATGCPRSEAALLKHQAQGLSGADRLDCAGVSAEATWRLAAE